MSEWKKETSAGGVVFKNENGRFFILLINPRKPNFGAPQDYWTFPKGHIDEEEDKKNAALREVLEESGVRGKIIDSLGSVKYFVNASYGKFIKFVDYYLMEYIDGDIANHDREVAEARWFKLEEAEKMLKFKHDKEMLGKARKWIEGKGL
jgi:8-oxo-dGTP pyrophosphatase MutT (NUDIX family)